MYELYCVLIVFCVLYYVFGCVDGVVLCVLSDERSDFVIGVFC